MSSASLLDKEVALLDTVSLLTTISASTLTFVSKEQHYSVSCMRSRERIFAYSPPLVHTLHPFMQWPLKYIQFAYMSCCHLLLPLSLEALDFVMAVDTFTQHESVVTVADQHHLFL